MKHVLQPYGQRQCGHCCVAMVSGEPLERIVELAPRKAGMSTKEIILILGKLGIRCDSRLRRIKDQLPPLSIVKMRFPERKSQRNWHWVVVNNQGIFDPHGAASFSDLENYEWPWVLSSYLEIKA